MSSNNENLAIQRIAKLVDENSFMEIGSLVTARSTDFNLILRLGIFCKTFQREK
jgi:acetyl-CoA carboxylase carboxyltransferase component